MPVRIVRDDTTNPWDVAAVLSSIVIGLISLALAGWALKASRSARRAVATERRTVFQLEILRDLLASFEDSAERWAKIADAPVLLKLQFGGRLALLPRDELPMWHKVADLLDVQDVARALGLNPDAALTWRQIDGKPVASPSLEVLTALRDALYGEVIAAVNKRMDEDA